MAKKVSLKKKANVGPKNHVKKVIKAKLSPQTKNASQKARGGQKVSAERDLDLIDLILADHKPLKNLIETLKDDEADFAEKKEAFEVFARLLKAHAYPEEQTWYLAMKEDDELIVDGLEGDVEHGLADQLCEELKREEDEDMFMAKVKVLAELVEHHIEEEEEDMLPEYRENSELSVRLELGAKYLEFQEEIEARGSEDAPSEAHPKARAADRRAMAR